MAIGYEFVLGCLITVLGGFFCCSNLYADRTQQEGQPIGFGTYPYTGKECANAVENAIKAGYRTLDTATFYQNFEAIGPVVNRYGRENFYIISKVWPDSQTAERLHADLHETLKRLNTNYLDAYLIHWPNSKVPIEETLKAMDALRKQGLVRDIGVSNFTVNHLKRALEVGVPIAWNQVEMNPYYYDPELLAFCREHGIVVQAWAPLGGGKISKDKLLADIGKKYGKTSSQVALRWIIQMGAIPLPASKNPTHIRSNIDVFDFTLTDEEMEQISARARNGQRQRFGLDEFDYSYEQCWPKRP